MKLTNWRNALTHNPLLRWAILAGLVTGALAGCVEQSSGTNAPQPATVQVASAEDSLAAGDSAHPRLQKTSPQRADADPTPRYVFRLAHDPDGIGKFYMDREIAWVMGFAAAPWLERPEREREEATSQMIESLKIPPGSIVADIGAGSGVLTVMLAAETGPTGKVYAVDIQQEMLDRLVENAKLHKLENIQPVLGTAKSPRLDPESIDLALMVDVYHEFAFPYEMMLEISKSMKTGGRVVFVEFRLEDPNVPIKLVHKMTQVQVKREIGLSELRLKWKETIDSMPWQHVMIFEKQKE
jgi:precorrin-6B methylase 2